MTPREKWREDAIRTLSRGAGLSYTFWSALHDETIYEKIQDQTAHLNYLTSEYIINIKTSDDDTIRSNDNK